VRDVLPVRLDPTLVEAVEPVAISDVRGGHEAEPREVELHAAAARREAHGIQEVRGLAVDDEALDHDGRRGWARHALEPAGVDPGQPLGRGKEETPVAGPDPRGLALAFAHAAGKPVVDAVEDAPDPSRVAPRERLQLLFGHAKDPAVGAHPEGLVFVLEDAEDAVAGQAVLGAKAAEALLREPAEPSSARADPERARPILVQRDRERAGEAVGGGEGPGRSVAQARQSPQLADPERSVARLQERNVERLLAAAFDGDGDDVPPLLAMQPSVAGDPDRPRRIFIQRAARGRLHELEGGVPDAPAFEHVDPPARVDPDAAAPVRPDGRDGIAREPRFRAVGGEPTIRKARGASAHGAHPQASIGTLVHALDVVAGEAVGGAVRTEQDVGDLQEAAPLRAHPQRALAILVQRGDGVGGHAAHRGCAEDAVP
jgi:hypothetical protein